MSRAITDALTIRPSPPSTGDTVSWTSTCEPSLRRRMASNGAIDSPLRTRSSARLISSGRFGFGQDLDRATDRLGVRVPVEAFGAAVPGQDRAVQRRAQDRVIARLDDRGQVAHRPLRPPAGADVAQVDGQPQLPRELGAGDRQLDRQLVPVSSHGDRFEPAAEHAHPIAGKPVEESRPLLLLQPHRDQQLDEVAADRGRGGVAEHLLGRPVEGRDAALGVHADDRIGRGVEHRSSAGLDRSRPALGLAAGNCLAQLQAESLDQHSQAGVRIAAATAEEPEHSDRVAPAHHGNGHPGLHLGQGGGVALREPAGRPALPSRLRECGHGGVSSLPDGGGERAERLVRRLPQPSADQLAADGVLDPDDAQFPVQADTDLLQYGIHDATGDGGAQRVRHRQLRGKPLPELRVRRSAETGSRHP